jgi:hypothetical protein
VYFGWDLKFKFWSIMANGELITINLKWKDYRNVFSEDRKLYSRKNMPWRTSNCIYWVNVRKMYRFVKDNSSPRSLLRTQKRGSVICSNKISNYTFDMCRRCLIINSKSCCSMRNILIKGVLGYRSWRDSKESILWLLIIMRNSWRRR